jgi:DNA-binding response OmpR family regulator
VVSSFPDDRHRIPWARRPKSATILVVEDDRRIAALIAKYLEAAGFPCAQAHDGDAALREFDRLKPSLLVLDLMLPGLGGLEITRRVRRESAVPILMLTARSSEGDKELGFEVGADDYLTKPFSTLELVARVRALLRRAAPADPEQRLVRGDLNIDPARREVRRGESRLDLTTLEFDLLYFLAARPGRIYSRESLMDHVWGDGRVVDDRSIDSLVSRLRRKVEVEPAKPRYIQTVWGAGYRFAEGIEP